MNFEKEQIDAVVAWMNDWWQLRGTSIPRRFREDFSIAMKVKQPPVGLVPRWVRDEERQHEIFLAIERFIASGKDIPREWIEEYVTLERKASEARRNPSME